MKTTCKIQHYGTSRDIGTPSDANNTFFSQVAFFTLLKLKSSAVPFCHGEGN